MPKPPYRTIVYVDGFNFYYGQVRGTPWKWLDPAVLFRRVLGPQNNLVKVKYFTARVQPSPNNPNVISGRTSTCARCRRIARWSSCTTGIFCGTGF